MSSAAPVTPTLSFEPLSAAVGAQVIGLDLSAPFDDATTSQLRNAFVRYGLLLVRGQRISTEEQTRFVELFGTVVIREKNVITNEDAKAQHVSNTRKDGILALGEIDFHMDQLFHEKPLKGIALYGIEIPSSGGDTRFASGCAAYESIPESLRRKVDGLSCRSAYTFAGDLAKNWNIDDARLQQISAVHPMAPVQPGSGRRALWVNKLTTVEVIGLPEEEGAALMSEVRSYVHKDAVIYTHRWRVDDLVIWDNCALMHARMPFDESQPRTLRRSPFL